MTSVINVDAFLQPLLQANDEEEAQRLLEGLIAEHIEPIMGQIMRRALPLNFGNSRAYTSKEDAEDIRSEVLAHLFKRLQDLKMNPWERRISDFRSYVAVTTYNACYQHLRQKYPNRWRLKNKLRYFLTHQNNFALWKTDKNEWLSGFAAWRGMNARYMDTMQLARLYESLQEIVCIEQPDERSVQQTNPLGLLTTIFNLLDHPLEFDDLVNVVGTLWGYKDQSDISLDDNVHQTSENLNGSQISLDEIIDQRLSLERLWAEVCQLPRKQRVALLLNLRDEKGQGIIMLIPFTRTATVRQIAEALEIPTEDFAETWNSLPLDDLAIAELLGATRQQVINLRKAARERLTRRIKTNEKQESGGFK
jgi:DNA-directed RNA polymerase specialized sigma24 family protein